MKASFFFSIAAFVLGYATHSWLSHSEAELASSREQILKEATTTVTQAQPEKVPPSMRENLNPNAFAGARAPAAVVPVAAPVVKPLASAGQPEVKPSSANDEFVTTLSSGEELWCRTTQAKIDPDRPVCTYEGSCYGCMRSRIIVPEVKTAAPVCANGNPAVEKTAICCAHGSDRSNMTCPDLRACFESTEPWESCHG